MINRYLPFDFDLEIIVTAYDEVFLQNKTSDEHFSGYFSFKIDRSDSKFDLILDPVIDSLEDRKLFETTKDFIENLKRNERLSSNLMALGYTNLSFTNNSCAMLETWNLRSRSLLDLTYSENEPNWVWVLDSVVEQFEAQNKDNEVFIASDMPEQYPLSLVGREIVKEINESPKVVIDSFLAGFSRVRKHAEYGDYGFRSRILILDIEFDIFSNNSRPEDLMYLGYTYDQAEYVWLKLSEIAHCGPSNNINIIQVSLRDSERNFTEPEIDSTIIQKNKEFYHVSQRLSIVEAKRLDLSQDRNGLSFNFRNRFRYLMPSEMPKSE